MFKKQPDKGEKMLTDTGLTITGLLERWGALSPNQQRLCNERLERASGHLDIAAELLAQAREIAGIPNETEDIY